MRTRFNREISPASMEIALGGQSSAFASNLMSAALALPFSGTARTLAQSQDASFASRQMPPMPSFADRGVRRIDKSTSSPSSRQGLHGVTPQHNKVGQKSLTDCCKWPATPPGVTVQARRGQE